MFKRQEQTVIHYNGTRLLDPPKKGYDSESKLLYLFYKYNANTYLLRNYRCWKQQNETAMHDGTFYKINMSSIINAFVYGPHPPKYHTILFLCHQLLSNLSHPQFHRDHVVCRTLRNPNPDVIPGRRPFPPEHTTDNPWHLQFITATLVQQAVLNNIRTLHLSTLNHKVMSLSDLSPLKYRDCWPGSSVGIANGYGLDGPGIEIPVGARFSAPVQTGPGAHPASCTMGTGSSPGIESGRGVTLTPHPLLVPRYKNRLELYLYSP
jgi:hypothetical protein